MGLKHQNRSNSETIMAALGTKNHGDVAEVKNNKGKSGNYYEDYTFQPDASLVRTSGEGQPRCGGEADFGAASHLRCNDHVGNRYQETTESSSSFEDDDSGPESGSAFSDDEFVPDYRNDVTFGGVGEVFRMRKKRLTEHWKEYIQPLMWRCKWVELRIRQLNWLEHKYTRELAKYNQNVLPQGENIAADLCSREVHHRGDKVFKRRRRKRIEGTMDIGTYMSEHNLFSYYDTKKDSAGRISSCEKWGNIGLNPSDEFGKDEELLFPKSRNGDENLEQVFSKIWTLMGHVSKLKSRLDKVMTDVPGRVSYANPKSSLVPCNALISSARDPASPPNNRDKMPIGTSHNASQLLSDFNMDDVALPESPVMGLWQFEDDNMIYNDKFYDGMNGFDNFNVQPAERPQVAAKEHQETAAPSVFEEPEMLTDEPAPKIRSIAQLTASSSRKSQRARKPRRF